MTTERSRRIQVAAWSRRINVDKLIVMRWKDDWVVEEIGVTRRRLVEEDEKKSASKVVGWWREERKMSEPKERGGWSPKIFPLGTLNLPTQLWIDDLCSLGNLGSRSPGKWGNETHCSAKYVNYAEPIVIETLQLFLWAFSRYWFQYHNASDLGRKVARPRMGNEDCTIQTIIQRLSIRCVPTHSLPASCTITLSI